MYLFELKVQKLDSMEEREVSSSSMIGDFKDLQDKQSIREIMEKLGNLIVEFNSDKKERKK